MLGKILSKIVGDPNEKVLKRLEPLVAEINALEPKYEAMHDDDLSAVTYELKGHFKEALETEAQAEAKRLVVNVVETVAKSTGFRAAARVLDVDSQKAWDDVARTSKLVGRSAKFRAVARTRSSDTDTDSLEVGVVDVWDEVVRLAEAFSKSAHIRAMARTRTSAAEVETLESEARGVWEDATSLAGEAVTVAEAFASSSERTASELANGCEADAKWLVNDARTARKLADNFKEFKESAKLNGRSVPDKKTTEEGTPATLEVAENRQSEDLTAVSATAMLAEILTAVETGGSPEADAKRLGTVARAVWRESMRLQSQISRTVETVRAIESDAMSYRNRAAVARGRESDTHANTLEMISQLVWKESGRLQMEAANTTEEVARSAEKRAETARNRGQDAESKINEMFARVAWDEVVLLRMGGAVAVVAATMIAEIRTVAAMYGQTESVSKILDGDARVASREDARLRTESEVLEREAERLIIDSMDDALPDAFAAIREASGRVLGMRPFDVQLMGAITLHEGKIAEMRTGEGKTLVATLPAYLSALAGQQVHVVTVNDYLAKRDAAWMGAVYAFMGLTVGCIQQNGVSLLYDELHTSGDGSDDAQDATGKFALNPDRHLKDAGSRGEIYDCDIVYGTNSEFGFDYLRGNIVRTLEERYQKKRQFAIVDEVDNILIDEARTPLIISGPSEQNDRDYNRFAAVGARLLPDEDFEIDEQRKSISITESGIDKAEKLLGMRQIYSQSADPKDQSQLAAPHLLENAIRAQHLYHRDREYVLRDGEVVLVDEFTGRLMEGRRLSDGLHQAIEAKEKIRVREESSTFATITLQNYFRLYERLSGMTGTASTEAEELLKIYGLEVTTIPTNREDRRIDHQDLIYMTEDAKWRALADKIETLHHDGRPVLVGTTTIEKSRIISDILKKRGIRHQVLNAHASRHQSESEIIAQAGVAGTVTVATNMAGRGTDIILGGNPELVQTKAIRPTETRPKKSRKNVLAKPTNQDGGSATGLAVIDDGDHAGDLWQAQHDAVVSSGGLFVLGTERHESRRIDNQLRGRAARQGDPGETQFYLSAEDDLVRRFGGDRIKGALGMFNWDEDTPVENAMLVKSVENAQQKVEGINFEIRKQLVEYDDVVNTQRAVVYEMRDRILTGMDLRGEIEGYVNGALSRAVASYQEVDPTVVDDEEFQRFQTEVRRYFPIVNVLTSKEDFEGKTRREIEDELHDFARRTYEQRVLEFSDETMKTLERSIMLRVLDRAWVGHLTRMENMRQGIGLQAIGQRDPLVQYRAMSFQLYEQMNQEIRDEVARTILNIAPGLGILGQRGANGQLVANQSDGRAMLQRIAVAQATRQQSVMAGAQQQQRSSGNGAPVRASDGRRLSRQERRRMEREQKRRDKTRSS